MNRVVLIGRLTKDPELKYTAGNGTAVSTFTLAVDRRANKDGKREADFIRIVAWNKTAELVANYMTKGRRIGISGRIQTGSYEGQDGKKIFTTDVVADEVEFLDNKKKDDNGSSGGGDDDLIPVDDGEIPF